MNSKLIWQSKHWGIGIGCASAIVGLILAVPENVNTWRLVEKHNQVFGYKYNDINYIRTNEIIPPGFEVTNLIPGKHEMKALGTGLLFMGSAMIWGFSQALVKDYERLETTNWKIRQSEFELKNIEIEQNTEVQRWAIELDSQGDISKMQQASVSYMGEGEKEEEEKPENQKFSENAIGYLAWLQSKNFNQAKVRDLGMLHFNKRQPKAEEIRKWIDELCVDGIAQWLDEKKNEFKLLTGENENTNIE